MREKLGTDCPEIAVADEDAVGIRLRKEPVARDAIGQPGQMRIVKGRRCTDFIAWQGIDHAIVHSSVRSSGDKGSGSPGGRSSRAISAAMSSSQRWVWSQELYWLATPRM